MLFYDFCNIKCSREKYVESGLKLCVQWNEVKSCTQFSSSNIIVVFARSEERATWRSPSVSRTLSFKIIADGTVINRGTATVFAVLQPRSDD